MFSDKIMKNNDSPIKPSKRENSIKKPPIPGTNNHKDLSESTTDFKFPSDKPSLIDTPKRSHRKAQS